MKFVYMLISLNSIWAWADADFASTPVDPHPQFTYQKFSGYQGHSIIAATGQEFAQFGEESLRDQFKHRADSICIKYGFIEASEYPVAALEGGQTRELAFFEGDEFVVRVSRPALSNWSIVTSLVGGMVWTDQRIYQSITCKK